MTIEESGKRKADSGGKLRFADKRRHRILAAEQPWKVDPWLLLA
jgi:hypothetical protein